MKREIRPFKGLARSVCTILLVLLSFSLFGTTLIATAEDQAAVPLKIKNIKFKLKDNGNEAIYIYSNRDFTPSVFALNDGRLIIDIKNLPAYKKGPSKIVVNGRFIRQIRTCFHDKSKTLRVVLDHNTSKNYIVNQIFFDIEKIYVIEVEEQQGA
jgi:hypothetical protein